MNGVGDDGGYVRFHAPHLGSGLRRKDGVVGSGFRRKEGGGGVRRKDVERLPQTGRGTFETGSINLHLPAAVVPLSFPFTMIPLLVVLSEAEGSRAEGLGVTGLRAADSSASLRMTLWEDVGQRASYDPGRPLHGS